MKIGLIISTYNWVEALSLVLDSVKRQAHLPDEVVICDDGSRSDTKNFIIDLQKIFPCRLKHVWQEDKGFRAAAIRNKGINELSSNIDYVVTIDGDMILHHKFIEDHIRISEKNCFIQGGRALISKNATMMIFRQKGSNDDFHLFSKGLSNRINTLYLPFLSNFFDKPSKKLSGVRTCNMSFWKDDLYDVNGFNEDFVGWGREDSELVVRLYNKEKFRKNIKFSGLAYHLHHEEKSRLKISDNDKHLLQSVSDKSSWCDNGLRKLKNNES
jgi:glycosyltransferase involved in cell wall biosynthesis